MSYMRDFFGRRLDSIAVPAAAETRPAPANKMVGFHAALANRATAACDVLVIADSIGEGIGATSLSNRWVNQWLTATRMAHSVANVAGGFGYQPAWSSLGLGPSPVETGTVTHTASGLGHRSSQLGAGAAIAFSSQTPATSFQLRLKRSTTDALTVAVDGGTASAIAAGPTGEFTYNSGALSTRQVHSVVVTQTAGTPEVEGLFWMDGDEAAGVRLWDGSKAGAKAADWTTASGGSQAWLTAATGFTPSLVIIGLGTNDALTVSAAAYKTNVANLISVVRGQWANVPILLVGSYQPPSRQTGLVEAWINYGRALSALAAADPAIAYLVLMNAIGSITTDAYGLLNDTTHPSNKGHLLYAQTVLDFVRPGLRDADAARAANLGADFLYLDTPSAGSVPPTPSTPGRGAVLFGDSNGAALVQLPQFLDVISTLGRTVSTATNQTWRTAWRYGRITSGASTVTMTLPASGRFGQEFIFKKVDAGAGTVVIAAANVFGNQQTIEGTNTKTLSGQWSWIALRSAGIVNGAGIGWEIVGQGGTVA